MKAISGIIVKVDNAYKDSITLKSGVKILMDENIRIARYTIRHGEVLAIPEGTTLDIKVGDTLFFHHNIVSEVELPQGTVMPTFYIDDGMYLVPDRPDWPMAFARIRDGEFKALDGVCFVEPIIEAPTHRFLIDSKEKPHEGVLRYPSPTIQAEGYKAGQVVFFKKESEYVFDIGDEHLYCMFDRKILGKKINK